LKSPGKVLKDGTLAWLSGWVTWVPVCFVWVLCWGTVILGPPATFALAQGANYATLGVMPAWGELASFARRYFWISWGWMLLNLTFGGLVAAANILLTPTEFLPGVVKWVTIVLVGLWLAIQFFTVPYLVLAEEKNLFSSLGDAVRTIYSAPTYALSTAGTGILVGILSLILVAPLIMGGAALVAVLGAQAAIDRPKHISHSG
jgi:hypothetical protein